MDDLITEHYDLLKVIHKYYSTRNKHFGPAEWLKFLSDCKLMVNPVGCSRREALLAFKWSQMTISDDIKKYKQYTSLTLFEFIEAVGRVCEAMDVPTKDELQSMEGNFDTLYGWMVALEGLEVAPPAMGRVSAGLLEEKTRPLVERADMVLECVAEAMQRDHNCGTLPKLIAKLTKLAEF
mmetsp:Transcript_18808/g.60394  ORF Transcript_18808/g.60394 Transcript_18808/m.60394 type:complete len:180 (+) Transcript_18808:158-697(+)